MGGTHTKKATHLGGKYSAEEDSFLKEPILFDHLINRPSLSRTRYRACVGGEYMVLVNRKGKQYEEADNGFSFISLFDITVYRVWSGRG
jgi:hypothetical protein